MEQLSKIIDYEIVSQKQQVSINGVTGEVIKKELVLSCPSCKTILYSNGYQGHLDLFFNSVEQQGGLVDYCPKCGQKLIAPMIVEAVNEK